MSLPTICRLCSEPFTPASERCHICDPCCDIVDEMTEQLALRLPLSSPHAESSSSSPSFVGSGQRAAGFTTKLP